MIEETKTAKAMVNLLNDFVVDYNNEDHENSASNVYLSIDGAPYKPSVDQTYVTEKLVTNDDHAIGISFTDSDIQRPYYEIKIFSPKRELKWPNLELANLIKKEFHKKRISLDEGVQTLQVSSVDQSPFMTLEAFHCTVLSVNLTVIASNK